ncbi:hypothetical protein HDU96_010392 [Phlyctochytrium bullatum]|nr:hypothetical protein HDU96_010392 [Phlyctochytrium bullatum]
MLKLARNECFGLNLSRPLHDIDRERNAAPPAPLQTTFSECQTLHVLSAAPALLYHCPDGQCYWLGATLFPSHRWPSATLADATLCDRPGELVVTTTDTTTGEQVAWEIPEKTSRRIPIIDPVTKEEVVYRPLAPASQLVTEGSCPPRDVVESRPEAASRRTRAWTTSEAELVCIPVEVRRRSRSEAAAVIDFPEFVESDSAVELDETSSESRPDGLARDSGGCLNAFAPFNDGFCHPVELGATDGNGLGEPASSGSPVGRVCDEMVGDSAEDIDAYEPHDQQTREVDDMCASSKEKEKPVRRRKNKKASRKTKRRSKK